MRLSLKKHFSSPRRRWQILCFCLILIVLNLTSSMVYQYHSNNKPIVLQQSSTKSPDLVVAEPKTVSYNEIPPDIIQHSAEEAPASTTTTVAPWVTFPQLDNPWFSDHNHDHKSDPLDLSPTDYENATINSCSFRAFKNASIFSQSEFIHDYVNFRRCIMRNTVSPLDQWIKKTLKAETGSRGEMIIKNRLRFRHTVTGACNENTKIVVAALSQSRRERDIIRQTWAKNLATSVKLIFFTHDADDDEDSVVITEIDINDEYFEFKQTLAMFIWLYENCPRARFVLKTTSDTYVNVPKMMQLVDQEMYAANRMYGELLRRMGPAWKELNNTKVYQHAIAKEEWPWQKYPPFLKGPSYIVSGDLVPRMLMASTVIPALPLAQIFFTGLVPLMGHIMRIGVASFFAFYPPPKDAEDPCEFSKYGAIHRMDQIDLMQIALQKSEEAVALNASCTVAPRCLAMVEGKCMMFSKDSKKKKHNFRWP